MVLFYNMSEDAEKDAASSSKSKASPLKKVKSVESAIKKYYIKAIKLIRAREFLAEFLGTFFLVVSI